jgi:hypothetical protein
MFFELRHAIDVDQHQIHGKVSWGPRDPTETAPRRDTTHRILWLRNIGLHGKEHARIDVNGYNDYHIDMYIYLYIALQKMDVDHSPAMDSTSGGQLAHQVDLQVVVHLQARIFKAGNHEQN